MLRHVAEIAKTLTEMPMISSIYMNLWNITINLSQGDFFLRRGFLNWIRYAIY